MAYVAFQFVFQRPQNGAFICNPELKLIIFCINYNKWNMQHLLTCDKNHFAP